MAKTLTLRVENDVYNIFRRAADGDRRTISNYLECAALKYIINEMYVSDEEMEDIMKSAPSLRKGLDDVKKGKYTIVK